MGKEAQQTQDTGMIAFARLMKIDVKNRLVYGRATQEIPDRVGEIFDYESSKPNFEKWSNEQKTASLGKSIGNVRAMHKDVAAGILIPDTGIVFHDDERAIDICAKVTDDQEWAKVETGTYTGFSIGGRYAKKWEDTGLKKVRYTADPTEISLVDRPAVPTATFFDVQKADGSVEKREFAKHEEPKAQLVSTDGKEYAVMVPLSKLPKPGEEFDFEGMTYQLRKVEVKEGHSFATVEVIYTVKGTPEELGEFSKLLHEQGLSIKEAGEIIAKADTDKPDIAARAMQLAYDEKKISIAGFAELDEAVRKSYMERASVELKKIAERQDTSAKEGKATYGNVKFADEKNKKYPLDTDAHVRAALSYWGMEKNRAKYSSEDQASIGGKIRAAAKDKGIGEEESKKLEAAFGEFLAKADQSMRAVVETKVYRKGLATCAEFANCLDSLCRLAESIEMEAYAEQDNSDIAAKIYNCIDDLGDVLQECIAEEVKEEVSGDANDQAVHANMVAAAEAVGNLRKRIAEFKKAHIAVASRHVQKVHDTSVNMGAKCMKIDNKGGVLETAAGYRKVVDSILAKVMPGVKWDEEMLTKVSGELSDEHKPDDTLAKTDTVLAQENGELKKLVGTLQGSLTSVEERLKKIEAQPAPARIVVRAVSKESEGNDAGLSAGMRKAAAIAGSVEPVRKSDGSLDEVATAMKITRAMGGYNVSGVIKPTTDAQ